MRIVFVFRDSVKGGFSIEGVFSGIIKNLPPWVQYEQFYYDQTKTLASNVLRLRATKADIYHVTGGVNYLTLFLYPRKTTITIHDLGHYKNLKGWRKLLFGWLWIKLPLWVVPLPSSVSEYTRQDIIRFFPSVSQHVQVIPNPVPTLFQFSPRPFNHLCPRILQVGTGTHKNLPTLFAAIAGMPCRLVIIGPLDTLQQNLLKQYAIEYEQLQNLSQEEVYAQYVQCDLVSLVTTHEGFGMPVLEAQAVGRPILTSRVCSLPEVSNGSAATVADPLDVDEVRAAILRIIREPAYREDLIRAGRRNIQRFDMEKIVAAYVELYKSVAG